VSTLLNHIYEDVSSVQVYLRYSNLGSSPEKLVSDMMLLDPVNGGKARGILFHPTMTYIGAACNCHSTYSHVCVVILTDKTLNTKMTPDIDVSKFTSDKKSNGTCST
jgi:hypothetical protein